MCFAIHRRVSRDQLSCSKSRASHIIPSSTNTTINEDKGVVGIGINPGSVLKKDAARVNGSES